MATHLQGEVKMVKIIEENRRNEQIGFNLRPDGLQELQYHRI